MGTEERFDLKEGRLKFSDMKEGAEEIMGLDQSVSLDDSQSI